MKAQYEIHLYSNTGVYLKTLTSRITSLEWRRRLGDVGNFELTLSDRIKPVDTSLFQLNGRVLIYRKAHAGAAARLEFMGFIRGWDFETDKRGVTRYKWFGPDQNDILASRTCFKADASYMLWRHGYTNYADTVMRLMVEDNLGAGGTTGVTNLTARNIVTSNTAGLTVSIEPSGTATQCGTAGMITWPSPGMNLLANLQGLSLASRGYVAAGSTAAVPVYFDLMLHEPTKLTFRCVSPRLGIDHRWNAAIPVYFGVDYGNLVEPRWRFDRTHEVNAGVALFENQAGSDLSWAVGSAATEAPLNRRENSTWATDWLNGRAQQLVEEGTPKHEFTGKIKDTLGCRYGIHWGMGDEVSVVYLKQRYDVRIASVGAVCKSGAEHLTPEFEVIQ